MKKGKDELRCWYTNDADGHVLGSVGIVFAVDEASARILMDEALKIKNLSPGDYTLHELPTYSGARIIFDGDY